MMILTFVDSCIIMILTFSVLYPQCFPDMMSKGYVSLNILNELTEFAYVSCFLVQENRINFCLCLRATAHLGCNTES